MLKYSLIRSILINKNFKIKSKINKNKKNRKILAMLKSNKNYKIAFELNWNKKKKNTYSVKKSWLTLRRNFFRSKKIIKEKLIKSMHMRICSNVKMKNLKIKSNDYNNMKKSMTIIKFINSCSINCSKVNSSFHKSFS